MKKATHQQTKEHNQHLVLQTLFQHESISRAEIARITSLTRTTVSDIVSDLIEEGLVSEVGIGSSLGGKSPILLSLVEDSRCFIGLDLGQNQFRGAVVNLRGKIKEMITVPAKDNHGNDPLTMVYEILDKLIEASCRPLVGISVGTPGLVNTNEGIVVHAINLNWNNLPLARLLQDRYHLSAYVFNDSQAAAMGEYIYGKDHKPEDHLIVINVGLGIGAGIILNGRLFQGDGGGAGEIGHVVVVPEGGLPCRCGHHGCLETVASAQAVVKRAQMCVTQTSYTMLPRSPKEINLDTIEQAFQAGDPLSRQIVLEAGSYIGMAIANLIGTLNINRIVLVGEMTRFGKPWLDIIQETMTQMSLSRLAQDAHVEIGKLGKDAIILSVSALLANNYTLLFNRQSV